MIVNEFLDAVPYEVPQRADLRRLTRSAAGTGSGGGCLPSALLRGDVSPCVLSALSLPAVY